MSFPIRELTPYHKTWMIKARVVAKSTMRTFNKTGSAEPGKVFSTDLIDAEGGEIRASFFNEAATKFESVIEEGKIYTMAKGTIRVANRSYNAADHDYEIVFGNASSQIVNVEDDGSITKTKLSFNLVEDFRTVKTMGLPRLIDAIGIVVPSDVQEVRNWSKDGKSYTKYQFSLADESEHTLDISLFGETTAKYPRETLLPEGGSNDTNNARVVAVKGVVVKPFNGGRSGVLNDSGLLVVDPTDGALKERAEKLKQWWQQSGKNKTFSSMAGTAPLGNGKSAVKTVTFGELDGQVHPEILADMTQSGTITEVYGRVADVLTRRRDEEIPIWYSACQVSMERDAGPKGPTAGFCNKKTDAQGHCPVHGAGVPTKLRWMARMTISDHSGHSYLQMFDDDAQKILGCTAEEASKIPPQKRDAMLNQAHFAKIWKFRLKSATEEWQGEMRVRDRVLACEPANLVDRTRYFLNGIKEMVAAQ